MNFAGRGARPEEPRFQQRLTLRPVSEALFITSKILRCSFSARRRGRRSIAWPSVEQGSVMPFTVDRSRSIISAMVLGRKVTAMDVAWLRREVFADGAVSREAADDLFVVERAGVARTPAWTELLVEMITRHVVWQSRPTGVVGEDQARWLVERTDSCVSANGLAVLVNVLSQARRAPRWFLAAVRERAAQNGTAAGKALSTAAE